MQKNIEIKLEEIRQNKGILKNRFDELTKAREQAERNYIALDGAEQVLLELLNKAVQDNIEEVAE